MSDPYLWLKALHIAGFAAWMAGMWYLPRLLVYHSETEPNSASSNLFKVMERRLLRFIATPAMVVTWLGGLGMIAIGGMPGGWLHLKLLLVVLLSGFHGLLAVHVKKFARDERPKPARWYRAVNEIPTVLFLCIIFLAVLRPF